MLETIKEMNIQAEKLELVRMILDTSNPNILKQIKDFFTKTKTADFWDTLSDEEKDDIEKGIIEIDNGEVVDYNEFIQSYQ